MSPLRRRLIRTWKTAQAVVAQCFFRFPGRRLRVIGVTGTDGKTTTAHLVATALESAGYTVGLVSTIRFRVGTREWANTTKLTTPGPWALAKLLSHMVRAGCHAVVLECSSHRLDQNGLWGLPVDVAVLTNISREHFDYHRDFADYTRAKEKLFDALRHPPKVLPFRRGIDPGGRIPVVAVGNLDDPRVRALLFQTVAEKRVGFTLGEDGGAVGAVPESPRLSLVRARRVGGVVDGLLGGAGLFLVRAGAREALLDLALPGYFNLGNALAAVAVGTALGIPLARITGELSAVTAIPGRLEPVDFGQPFTVLLDYAVTPAAFEALFGEVARVRKPSAMILHVFGAAGERDRGKRPLLGELAARHADVILLTDEDPFGENPVQILDDLESGIRRHGAPRAVVLRIRDRRAAIREALRRARPGDIVLVTGKGAEETMAVGKQRIPWSDRQVIREELARVRHTEPRRALQKNPREQQTGRGTA